MRAGALVMLGLIFTSPAMATPPGAGGVMIASDSSVVLFWTHPDINSYEQGYDDMSENGWLVGGEEPGQYAVAVEFQVPFASYLESILIRMYTNDQIPEQPGDQFSPFTVAISETGPGSSPMESPLYEEIDLLCGGEPCTDDWYRQPLVLPFVTAGRFWQIFRWSDSTPAAPQLRRRIRQLGDPSGLYGFDNGGGYVWSDLYRLPIFRQRLLGIIPLDTAVNTGWRRRMAAENPPDSFLIYGFLSNGGSIELSHAITDTLMHRLTGAGFDSLKIRSCYGGVTDDSGLVVIMDKAKRPPILADVVYPESRADPATAALRVLNIGSEPLSLRLGYDRGSIIFDADTVALAGHESKMISCMITESPDDTTELMIIIGDRQDSYYPLVVTSTFPQGGQTDADGDREEHTSEIRDRVNVYPSPCMKSLNIVAEDYRAVRDISVYNIIGQRVANLPAPFRSHMTWNGCDRDGRPVPPGIYLVRIRYDEAALTRTVLLMR